MLTGLLLVGVLIQGPPLPSFSVPQMTLAWDHNPAWDTATGVEKPDHFRLILRSKNPEGKNTFPDGERLPQASRLQDLTEWRAPIPREWLTLGETYEAAVMACSSESAPLTDADGKVIEDRVLEHCSAWSNWVEFQVGFLGLPVPRPPTTIIIR